MNKTLKNTILATVLTSFMFAAAACDLPKRIAQGKEDEIIVIADSIEYNQLEPVLQETFGKVIYTPQAENLFVPPPISSFALRTALCYRLIAEIFGPQLI
jgi:hypothetical protein